MKSYMSFRWRRFVLPYVFVLPSSLFVCGVLGYAIVVAVKDSLHRYPMLAFNAPGTFVGFDNYKALFLDQHFQNSIGTTFVFVFGTVVLGIVLSFVLAMAIYNLRKAGLVFRTLTLIPYLISGVAAAVMWRFLFNSDAGFINLTIKTLGGPSIRWLSEPVNALIVVTLSNIWKIFPMSTMLILAGLQAIDPDIYEATVVEGAKSAQVFIKITLPLLGSFLSTSLIWLTFASFNMFEAIYPLTGGGPTRATEVMALFMYRLGFGELNFSMSSAVMVLLLLINLVFSGVFIKFFRNRT